MQFTKQLREPVERGEITCSIRVWVRPKVKVGADTGLERVALSWMGSDKSTSRVLLPVWLAGLGSQVFLSYYAPPFMVLDATSTW